MIALDTIAAHIPPATATLDLGLPAVTIPAEEEACEVHIAPHPDPSLVTVAIICTSPTEPPEVISVRALDRDVLLGELVTDAIRIRGVYRDAAAQRAPGRPS